MFDRAAHRRSDAAWLAQAWPRSRVVPITARSATSAVGGRLVVRGAADAPNGVRRFLGVVDGVPYFAVTADPADSLPAEGGPDAPTWVPLREFGAGADELEVALVIGAVALEQWHQRHTHCPRCGALTVETQAGWTRTCTADGSQHFPRTDPAVIMLVHDGADGPNARALLGRGPQWEAGRFSTLAGFVEPGESLESAVEREVGEEVGVRIRDIRYLGSQPWPFPASLMVGFVARLDGDATLTLDPVEMAEAGWFTRAEVQRAADRTDDATEIGFSPRPAAVDSDGTGSANTDSTDDNIGTALRAIPPHFSISRFLIDRWLAADV